MRQVSRSVLGSVLGMAIAFLLFLAVTLLQGCRTLPDPDVAPHEIHIVLHGDERFSREERQSVEAAAEAWRKLSRGRIDILIRWDRGPLHDGYYVIEPVPYLSVFAKEGAPACGATRGGVVQIVKDERHCGFFYPTVLHELGHLAGLEHVDRPGAAMHHDGTVTPYLTAADEWLCVKRGICVDP